MIKGFKEFIAQGNALELAVAVIIGGAFKPIVDSITTVIMTILGQLIGQPNFDSVGQFKIFASADKFVQPGTIITAVVNFLLVAAAVYFAIVMPMNKILQIGGAFRLPTAARCQPQCGGTSRRRRASLEPAPPGAGASRPSTGPLRASCS